MWTKFNQIMLKHGYVEPNFKGFMADITHASWNAVKIVYGSGDATIRMVDKKRTCLFHWTHVKVFLSYIVFVDLFFIFFILTLLV